MTNHAKNAGIYLTTLLSHAKNVNTDMHAKTVELLA